MMGRLANVSQHSHGDLAVVPIAHYNPGKSGLGGYFTHNSCDRWAGHTRQGGADARRSRAVVRNLGAHVCQTRGYPPVSAVAFVDTPVHKSARMPRSAWNIYGLNDERYRSVLLTSYRPVLEEAHNRGAQTVVSVVFGGGYTWGGDQS